MKKILIPIAAMALAATNALAIGDNGQLVIEELNESIVATYNGSALSVTLTGPTDGWTIELPSGFSFSSAWFNSPESLMSRRMRARTTRCQLPSRRS